MTTIKAQLKNDNGDIIIPAIASIQTNEIEDEAVTNSKIDFSTFIKTGTATVNYQQDNSGGGFVGVTFDTPFTNTPIVFAQDVLSTGRVGSLTVSGVTTSGFRLLARNAGSASSGSLTVNWIAISLNG
jgi:hypothetical protein